MTPVEPVETPHADRAIRKERAAKSKPPVHVAVIGIGCGSPDHLTLEAVRILAGLDAVLLTDKRSGNDPLVEVRRAMIAEHAPQAELVVVDDPPRERRSDQVADQAAYEGAVTDWHAARARAYAEALQPFLGRTVGMLVWGDPAFYDSALRILDQVGDRGLPLTRHVVPGISAVSLLAARHGLVLNDIGSSVTITTGRRLAEQVAAGADNLLVMLNRHLDAANLPGDWSIWWAGNLGTEHESLVAGDLHTQAERIEAERDRLRATAGWVMDIYLVRRAGPN